jgi:predicted HTH domain antitoxin
MSQAVTPVLFWSALAVQLYRSKTVSIGLAARIASTSLEQFMGLLGQLGIEVIDYDPAELERELQVLE